MKKLVLLVTALSLVSCGKNEPTGRLLKSGEKVVGHFISVGEKIGQIPRKIGNALLGTDEDSNEDLDDLENRVDDLELIIAEKFVSLEAQITLISSSNTDVQETLQRALKQLRRLKRRDRRLFNELEQVEDLINDFTSGYVTIIDPCGDDPRYIDEVLIKLFDGSILGVFKDGQYYMGVLEDGSYRTTDKTHCNFRIVNGEVLNDSPR